jgi:1-acyl-sn-glycerol-3-phosphate acyltransferase
MMPSIRVVIHTLVSRFLLALLILVIALPVGILLLLPARWRYDNRFYFWIMQGVYVLLLKVTFIRVTYKGLDHILQNEPAIIVANHQSSLDIPLIGAVVGHYPHIWLAKQELLESLFFRLFLPRVAVMVDTSTPLKAMKSLVQALSLIENKKRHAILFPEGGRYIDGQIHDFYLGFVILAKKTHRPVIPLRIFNAQAVYPPNSFWAYNYPITVVVGKPMMMQDNETEQAFSDRVRNWFIEQREG